MNTRKYRTAVEWARGRISWYINQGNNLLDAIDSGEASQVIRSDEYDFIARVAVASVLAAGLFQDETGEFMMPSTQACLRRFEHTRRCLANHKTVRMLVCDYNDLMRLATM